MRFLLDQGLPRSAAAELVRLGHEAEHIGDLGSIRAPDEAIVELATEREAVAVTLDADFHRIVALGNRTRPSVIFLREQGLKGAAVAQIVAAVASQHAESLEAGVLLTVRGDTIRIRALPVYAAGPEPRE